jgi:7 transmembrane sweet-taste receptor of 3 GCPR/Regulator of G protein signaling domain
MADNDIEVSTTGNSRSSRSVSSNRRPTSGLRFTRTLTDGSLKVRVIQASQSMEPWKRMLLIYMNIIHPLLSMAFGIPYMLIQYPEASGHTILGVVGLLATVPHGIVGLAWFHIRRNHQPVKARMPNLVLLCGVFVFLYVVSTLARRTIDDNYPCWISFWQDYGTIPVIALTLFARIWLLFYAFYRAQQIYRTSKHQDDDDGFDYNRWSKYSTPGAMFKVIAVAFILASIYPAIFSFTNTEELQDHNADCDLGASNYFFTAEVASIVLAALYAAKKLSGIADAFWISFELKVVGYSTLAAMVVWVIFTVIPAPHDYNVDHFPFSTLAAVIVTSSLLGVITYFPVALSYRSVDTVASLPSEHELRNIDTVLQNVTLREFLEQYLLREFSVENLVFLVEVDRYRRFCQSKKGPGPAQRLVEMSRQVLLIATLYVGDDAEMQVNLPAHIVKDIESRLPDRSTRALTADDDEKRTPRSPIQIELVQTSESSGSPDLPADSPSAILSTERPKRGQSQTPEPRGNNNFRDEAQYQKLFTIFDDAYNNIYRLLKTDAFVRFQMSHLFTDMARDMTARRNAQQALKERQIL